MNSRTKKILRWMAYFPLFILTTFLLVELWVIQTTNSRISSSIDDFPSNKVGLLLGTGKHLTNGRINLYYQYRLQAAIKLFKNGKIEYVLVSGDNSREDYDEPTTIKEDLIAAGIPEHRIYLDYAGFRTLDSVIRAKEIFGLHKLTIISQEFHNERAICIADFKGIDAVGFSAQDVSTRYGLKVVIRERFARVKMGLDLIFGKGPKFLGEKIHIGSTSSNL